MPPNPAWLRHERPLTGRTSPLCSLQSHLLSTWLGERFVAIVVPLESRRRPSLDGLVRLVRDDLEATNQVILDRMASRVELIPQLAGHIIASGGKRLRPMLTLAGARLCGYRGPRHVQL